MSQASSDVWVVVVLYKDGYPECGVLMQCVKERCWHVFICAFTSQSDYAAMVVYPLHFEDEIFRVLAGQPTCCGV
ncbi:hypothetical protein Hanom_Chr12g01121381 [Helianthus anomalus]